VFAVTVARGRPQPAAFGSLVAAVVTLTALNLVNPEALIARYNLTHQADRPIDFAHLAQLGGDAVPIVAAQIQRVPQAERCQVVATLRSRYLEDRSDWRGWNLARARAHAAVTRLEAPGLCAVATSPEPPGRPR
jgi:hypothetical protein